MRCLILAQTDNLTPARDVVWWSFYILLSAVAVFELVNFFRGKEKATKRELEEMKRESDTRHDEAKRVYAEHHAAFNLLSNAYNRTVGEFSEALKTLKGMPASVHEELKEMREESKSERKAVNGRLDKLNADLTQILRELPVIKAKP